MASKEWTNVDDYFIRRLHIGDAVMDAALAANAAANLPSIDVSYPQGRFLNLLARMTGARHILEIGTLGGFSTIWLARALPEDGWMISLEFEPHHAAVARANIEKAGLADKVEIKVGPALESLDAIVADGGASFDLIFIDADKPNNPRYLEWALRLSHPGTVIILDNVVRDGAVVDARSTDPNVIGTRRFVDMVAAEPRLDATALQTVGTKGWDGFVMALVK